MIEIPKGTEIQFGPYDYQVPTKMPQLDSLLRLASQYLEAWDVATTAWGQAHTEAQRTKLNGTLLGIGGRARSALRATQLLVGHHLPSDAVATTRPIVEALIFVQFILNDGNETARLRAEAFEAFQWVERRQDLQAADRIGVGARHSAEHRADLIRRFEEVKDRFPGEGLQRTVFASPSGGKLNLRGMAEAVGLSHFYDSAFAPSSTYLHINITAVGAEGDPTLALMVATLSFNQMCRSIGVALGLAIADALTAIEAEHAPTVAAIAAGSGGA